MQTLHLVNPGRTDIDKSTLRQNPYLVDECYADLDSNTDRSSLRQNLYLVDRCSGDIDSNSALHVGHAVNINTMSGFSDFAKQSAVGAAKAAAGGFYSAVRGTASGISSLAKAAAETDTTRTHSASAAATDTETDTTRTHSASAAATDTRKSRSESRPIEKKPEKPRSMSRPPKEKTGPPKEKKERPPKENTGPRKEKQRSVSRPPKEKKERPPKAPKAGPPKNQKKK